MSGRVRYSERGRPVATFNLLRLVSIPPAAWSAFVLCHYLINSYWPSILGGYIFGFSPPLLGQLIFAHLYVLYIFAIPLALYYSARYFNGEIRWLRFTLTPALLLVIEFLCSVEIFASFTLSASITPGSGVHAYDPPIIPGSTTRKRAKR